MAKKTFAIEVGKTHLTTYLEPPLGSGFSSETDGYSLRIGYENEVSHSYGSYEWTFTSNWKTGAGISGTVSVESAYLEFYYHSADSPNFMPEFEIVRLTTAPSTQSAVNGWNAINSSTTVVSTVSSARGDAKNIIRVPISDSAAIAAAINTPGGYFLGIRRKDDTRDTRIEIGGKSLTSGKGSGWVSTETDLSGQPKLIVTLILDDSTHLQYDMRYTTEDPTSDQNTPSNSLGSYCAKNSVFVTSKIGNFLSSNDTEITIDSNSDLPSSSSGIAQVGPEIISYAGINAETRQLTGVVRAVAPSSSFPSEVDKFSEYIRYLDVDNLFDKKPSDELEQYRCVGIIQTSSFALNNVTISLVKKNFSNTNIDIGIEVPAFDRTTGFVIGTIIEGSKTFRSDSASVIGKESGYFNGAYIVLDPSGTPFEAIVESYDSDGSEASFIVDRVLPELSGPDFIINPGPAQRTINEKTKPGSNSGRFFGFFEEGGSKDIGYDDIRENGSTMNQYDVFYLWIKRTFIKNKKSSNKTGAVIVIQGTQ